MEIRPASDQDVPAIVALLKISLGESLMPKSEIYWRWKHLLNPFGPSPVLLAIDSGTIIGVRAFMRWEWKNAGKIYSAIRAVDTATHPDHQGKGIFKKLTLSLLKECEERGDAFVFNTPNAKSKAGYLKMGWQTAGRLPVRINVRRPFEIVKNIITRPTAEEKKFSDDQLELEYFLNHPQLSPLIRQTSHGDSLVTNVSPYYLRWRYLDVPVLSYSVIGSESGGKLRGLILGRIKATRLGREFRITDIFLDDVLNHGDLITKFRQKMRAFEIDYTTLSGTALPAARRYRILSGSNLRVGPIVTIRPLREQDLSHLNKFQTWAPTLGDLELF